MDQMIQSDKKVSLLIDENRLVFNGCQFWNSCRENQTKKKLKRRRWTGKPGESTMHSIQRRSLEIHWLGRPRVRTPASHPNHRQQLLLPRHEIAFYLNLPTWIFFLSLHPTPPVYTHKKNNSGSPRWSLKLAIFCFHPHARTEGHIVKLSLSVKIGSTHAKRIHASSNFPPNWL